MFKFYNFFYLIEPVTEPVEVLNNHLSKLKFLDKRLHNQYPVPLPAASFVFSLPFP